MYPGAQNTTLVQGGEDDGCSSKEAVGITIIISSLMSSITCTCTSILVQYKVCGGELNLQQYKQQEDLLARQSGHVALC